MFNYLIRILAAPAAVFPTLAADAGSSDMAGALATSLSASAVTHPRRKAHQAGATEYRIDSGDIERRYLMYVPESLDPDIPAPVVFDFHGSDSDPSRKCR